MSNTTAVNAQANAASTQKGDVTVGKMVESQMMRGARKALNSIRKTLKDSVDNAQE